MFAQTGAEPGLTYFVELRAAELWRLLHQPGVVDNLVASRAAISMAMIDLTSERRRSIELLQRAGVPVTAWLLLDGGQGYWLNADNPEHARQRYLRVRDWLRAAGTPVRAIGLDVEPPIADMADVVKRGFRGLWDLVGRRRRRDAHAQATAAYARLVAEMRQDGFFVETYQFPMITDERIAGSSIVQRALGIVDVPADREVLMLYRSLLPSPLGEWLVDSYGPVAGGIAVGITGGGVDFVLQSLGSRLLEYRQLVADLQRARRYTDRLYVFSLEGCIERGYFERLCRTRLDPAPSAVRFSSVGRIIRGTTRLVLRGEPLARQLRELTEGWKRRWPVA